ncbi:MAG: hypothetical protein HZB53_15785 [Chloroflexi bacterium]|nr:hypothetical protein [Chloroflexota bacterium]
MNRLQWSLAVAAAYHAVSGLALFAVPGIVLRAINIPPALYEFSLHVLLFRLAGVLSLVVALGAYRLARGDGRNADLAALLLLAKAAAAVTFLYYAARGESVAFMLLAAVVNELIWLPVFGWALRQARRRPA